MQMSPVIAVHLTAAIAALVIGPVALWARKGHAAGVAHTQHPRLHRAAGYAWVTLMLMAAITALFIHDHRLPNIAGYTPIHLLVFVTFYYLITGFLALFRRDIATHRRQLQRLYLSAGVIAGLFALLPNRYLGQLIWHQWLGLV